VDVQSLTSPLPKQVVVDASVLYWAYYPNFDDLRLAGGAVRSEVQRRPYSAWLDRALKAGTQLFASAITLGEFVRLMEYAEMEAIWITDPARSTADRFNPSVCKQTRWAQGPAELERIRRRANTFLNSARKAIDLLPRREQSVTDEQQAILGEWLASAGDYADATLVANAKAVFVPHILADDRDLLTFADITVYTANRHALDLARGAGKLTRHTT